MRVGLVAITLMAMSSGAVLAETPLPSIDFKHGCESRARDLGPFALKQCLSREQGSLNLLSKAWPVLTEAERTEIIAYGTRIGFDSYTPFETQAEVVWLRRGSN